MKPGIGLACLCLLLLAGCKNAPSRDVTPKSDFYCEVVNIRGKDFVVCRGNSGTGIAPLETCR